MDFRWVAFITLWTLLSGPVFSSPTSPASVKPEHKAKVVKFSKTSFQQPARR